MPIKFLTILISCFCAVHAAAQKNLLVDCRGRFSGSGWDYIDNLEKLDTVRLRIQYSSMWRETKSAELQEDMESLYIGDHMSEYRENTYQYAFEHLPPEWKDTYPQSMDSLMEKNGVLLKIRWSYKQANYTIQKNYPEQGIQTCYYDMMPDVGAGNPPGLKPLQYYMEDIPVFDWELLDGDTTICGYPCQAACTSFRGRTWRVWYAPDLPYQEGPWKLCGLPGVILKADDDLGDFHFLAIEIREPKDEYIFDHPYLRRFVKSSFQRVMEVTKLRYEKPKVLYDLMWTGEIRTFIERDVPPPTFPPAREPCLMELYE